MCIFNHRYVFERLGNKYPQKSLYEMFVSSTLNSQKDGTNPDNHQLTNVYTK